MNRAACFMAANLESFKNQSSFSLSDLAESTQQHLKSHRIKANESICFLDGQGSLFYTKTVEASKSLSFTITRVENRPALVPQIDLYLSPPLGQAFEETLIQGCEIGVSNFYLIRSQHNQHNKQHVFKKSRLDKILESSCTQCTQPWLPKLHAEWLSIDEALLQAQNSTSVVAQESLAGQLKPGAFKENFPIKNTQHFSLWVGPEGGWSKDEEFLLEKKAPILLCLGDLILRVPTAVVAASFWIRSHFNG